MLEKVNNWRGLKGSLRKQIDNAVPAPTGETITVEQFIERFPNYRTDTSTIYEPPMIDFIAKESDEVNYWLSFRYDIFFKNYK